MKVKSEYLHSILHSSKELGSSGSIFSSDDNSGLENNNLFNYLNNKDGFLNLEKWFKIKAGSFNADACWGENLFIEFMRESTYFHDHEILDIFDFLGKSDSSHFFNQNI